MAGPFVSTVRLGLDEEFRRSVARAATRSEPGHRHGR